MRQGKHLRYRFKQLGISIVFQLHGNIILRSRPGEFEVHIFCFQKTSHFSLSLHRNPSFQSNDFLVDQMLSGILHFNLVCHLRNLQTILFQPFNRILRNSIQLFPDVHGFLSQSRNLLYQLFCRSLREKIRISLQVHACPGRSNGNKIFLSHHLTDYNSVIHLFPFRLILLFRHGKEMKFPTGSLQFLDHLPGKFSPRTISRMVLLQTCQLLLDLILPTIQTFQIIQQMLVVHLHFFPLLHVIPTLHMHDHLPGPPDQHQFRL